MWYTFSFPSYESHLHSFAFSVNVYDRCISNECYRAKVPPARKSFHTSPQLVASVWPYHPFLSELLLNRQVCMNGMQTHVAATLLYILTKMHYFVIIVFMQIGLTQLTRVIFPSLKRTIVWFFLWFCNTSRHLLSPSLVLEQCQQRLCHLQIHLFFLPHRCLQGMSTSSFLDQR